MRAGRVPGLVALLLLGALAALSVLVLQPPAPAASDAPADRFSAGRAFADVEEIARETHVTGSAADDRVRDHLLARLTGLGLQPRVQDAVGANPGDPGEVEMARVRNVVAELPGRDPTGRLLLVAHHDSVETGPGGNDDAAGVSSVLETLRALTAGPQLRNDVVVVFTDAEEACLCGAEAFAAGDPLAADGGVVLNLEARGTGGPPIMFETARGNAGLAGVFAAAAPHPVATSFAVEVYRALPNDTDFSPLLDAGFTGLNTAWIEGSAAYHTPEDTPDRMDRGSLQAMGDNALALTRELGGRDLRELARPGDADAVYFPVLGRLVRFPGWSVWPLAGLAVAALGGLAALARSRAGTPLRRSLAGFGLALLPVVLAPLAAQGAWALLTAVRPGYAGMIDPWRPGWYRLGVVALVLFVVLAWYALLRRVGATALAVGALGWPVVLGAVLAAVAPGGSYLAALPALAGGVAGVVGLLSGRPWVRLLGALLAGAVAVVVLAPTIALFFPALGLATGAAPALFAVLLALVLLPVLELLFPAAERAAAGERPRRRGAALVPAVAGVLVVALFGTGLVVDRFDARHPVPTQLMYALDADRDRAWWISTEDDPVDWTARYVGGHEDLGDAFPVFSGDVTTGRAEAADLPAPALTTAVRDLVGGRRELTVRLQSQRAARLVVLDVAGAEVTGAVVAGREVPAEALGTDRLTVTFHAPPAEGVTATVEVSGDGPVTVRALDGSDGLADLPGFVPRPAGVGVAGTHTSDLLVVGTSREVR
ncbi:M28 family peptidase [Modestobacter sp. NPDC049651]|uniref:M28 family peptidase n=1 Tax=unclassified Modestobacter TaxID=2643866 RepID=UPI0033F0BA1E